MKRGFLYLSAMKDVSNRFECGWALSIILHAELIHRMLHDAFKEHGKPEILT